MKQIHASITSQNGAETGTLTQTLFESPVSVKAALVDTRAPDFTRFARKPSERVAIVEHIYATPNLQETDYLEWKTGYDLSKRPGAAATARQLIGMANRDTAHAMRHTDGHAYILLGVEPGNLSGVPEWDSADIEKWLTPFVGPDLRYDAYYVRVEGRSGHVLFLTIDPPREGDPIYNSSRSSRDPVTSKSLDAGTIYVRHGSNTAPAKPDDLKRLSARLATGSSDHHLAIEVQPSPETVLRRLDVCKEAIEGYARGRYNELLGTRWSQKNASMQSITVFKGMVGESRTRERFEQEVESYRKALEEKLPDILYARSVAHNFNLLPLSIVNSTNGTFAGVKVELWIPNALAICVWERERSGDLHPPVEPIPYGEKTMMSELSHGPYIDLHTPGLTSLIEPHWIPTYHETDEYFHIVFVDEEVRAEGRRTLPDIWLMLDHEAPDKLSIRWRQQQRRRRGACPVR